MRRTARVKKEKEREGGQININTKQLAQLSCLLLPKTPATIRARHVACYVYICVCVCMVGWTSCCCCKAQHSSLVIVALKSSQCTTGSTRYTHRHTHMYSVHETCMCANTDACLDKLWQTYVYDTYFIYKPMIMLR